MQVRRIKKRSSRLVTKCRKNKRNLFDFYFTKFEKTADNKVARLPNTNN